MPFKSTHRYEPSRIQAAALYCSDGRIGEQFDEFLHIGLQLPRYDRLCLPGGPACLAGDSSAELEQHCTVDALRFLVEVHKLERVVLIAHQGCAYYTTRLKLKEPDLELAQRTDLARAAAFVHRITKLNAIEAYFARLRDDRVTFDWVPV